MQSDIYIGLDIGTSGARAVAMARTGTVLASSAAPMEAHAADRRDPAGWLGAAMAVLEGVCQRIERGKVRAIAVDGTSGTMIPIDDARRPLTFGRMYNDACQDTEILERIAGQAPPTSAAHGATSGLAKVLELQATPGVDLIVHQADWIASMLCGVVSSDDNNALKTGFDPVARDWPDWIAATGANGSLLPKVARPGTPLAAILPDVATRLDLPRDVIVTAGTTDGCAAFLATGASEAGDGVTSLGTTLVLKVLSDRPIFAPQSGIYSHFVMGLWLAGGASNTGGGVLLDHFSPEEIAELTPKLDPERPLNLGYYPLRQPGERFPIADPLLQPKLDPRPDTPHEFLQAMLEGMSEIEAKGYEKLSTLGAPQLKSVRTVGGGAKSAPWTTLRARRLGVPMHAPQNPEAAYGAAVLARYGMTT